MTPAELRAAADIVRALQGKPGLLSYSERCALTSAEMALSKAWLADHAVDDGTEVSIEWLTAGVWEISHENWEPEIVLVNANGTVVDFGDSRFETVQDAITRGWQFTARYVRCDGEPIPCWAHPRNGSLFRAEEMQPGRTAEEYRASGFVPGVFVPLTSETDDDA